MGHPDDRLPFKVEIITAERPETEPPLTWHQVHALMDLAGLECAGSPTVHERLVRIRQTLDQKQTELTNAHIQNQRLQTALSKAESNLEEFKALFANGHRHNGLLKQATGKAVAQNEPLERLNAVLAKENASILAELKASHAKNGELLDFVLKMQRNPLAFWAKKWYNALVSLIRKPFKGKNDR